MRFKAQIRNIGTLAKFCASLSSLGPIAWCRLCDHDIRFTVLPEKGSQVWSVLKIETVFETYHLQSAATANTINLEVPIQSLQRALKSAIGATSASIRLTKKDHVPMLSLTIVTTSFSTGQGVVVEGGPRQADDGFGQFNFSTDDGDDVAIGGEARGMAPERETVIVQDVPVKVLAMEVVEGLHEPSTPEPDVHIYLPSLAQVKSISERFTRLAAASTATTTTTSPTATGSATRFSSSSGGRNAATSMGAAGPRLELSANMHGSFRISLVTDALSISSRWTGLVNPELEPSNYPGGSQEIRDHPSSRMRLLGGVDGQDEAGWARVRIDAKDWNRVLSVGRLGVRVIACFINETGLVLYVYHQADDEGGAGGEDETCLTYFVNAYRG